MEWRDEGVILAVRKHQETAAIVELLTADHGRHAGVVRGGTSRKMTPHLQPGNRVDVVWQARLEDHLGTFKLEVTQARAATLMGS
ncbi:MAG: DNA repair protein RecO, partial [Pseudomonadota bacterium]